MCACGDEEVGKDICRDMIKVIMAWRRGELLPQWEVPRLAALYKELETPDAIT
jgi:hypothetical protein